MVLLADQVTEVVLQAVVLVVTQVEVRLGRPVPMGLVVTRVDDRPGRLVQRRPLKSERQCLTACLRALRVTRMIRIPQEEGPPLVEGPEGRDVRMMMTIASRRLRAPLSSKSCSPTQDSTCGGRG